MNAIDNPYTPGAGVPPAVMAGRDDIINSANLAYNRVLKGNFAKCQLLLGLRGVERQFYSIELIMKLRMLDVRLHLLKQVPI
jgi:hypothetical protein